MQADTNLGVRVAHRMHAEVIIDIGGASIRDAIDLRDVDRFIRGRHGVYDFFKSTQDDTKPTTASCVCVNRRLGTRPPHERHEGKAVVQNKQVASVWLVHGRDDKVGQ